MIKQQKIFINETITLQFYFQNFASVQRIYKLKNISRNKRAGKLLNSKKQTKEILVILLNIT